MLTIGDCLVTSAKDGFSDAIAPLYVSVSNNARLNDLDFWLADIDCDQEPGLCSAFNAADIPILDEYRGSFESRKTYRSNEAIREYVQASQAQKYFRTSAETIIIGNYSSSIADRILFQDSIQASTAIPSTTTYRITVAHSLHVGASKTQ